MYQYKNGEKEPSDNQDLRAFYGGCQLESMAQSAKKPAKRAAVWKELFLTIQRADIQANYDTFSEFRGSVAGGGRSLPEDLDTSAWLADLDELRAHIKVGLIDLDPNVSRRLVLISRPRTRRAVLDHRIKPATTTRSPSASPRFASELESVVVAQALRGDAPEWLARLGHALPPVGAKGGRAQQSA